MKKVIVLLAGLFVLSGVGMVFGATIDFESFSAWDVVSGPGVFADVVFTQGSNNIVVAPVAATLGPDFGGNNAASGLNFDLNPFKAEFLIGGISSVSVVLGDNGGDYDDIYLAAYNSSNVQLDYVTEHIPLDYVGGKTLTVSDSDIAYVLFGSLPSGVTTNSVYWDNFSYATSIPEPSTLLLLGSGLVGLVWFGRKKFRK